MEEREENVFVHMMARDLRSERSGTSMKEVLKLYWRRCSEAEWHVRHVMLETIRQGTTTSATVMRTGNDEANRDAVIAATKNMVLKHLRAFSATIHDFHATIIPPFGFFSILLTVAAEKRGAFSRDQNVFRVCFFASKHNIQTKSIYVFEAYLSCN